MTEDIGSLANIVKEMPDDQKKQFDNNGLYSVVEKFGERDGDKTILKMKLGNLIISDDPSKLIEAKLPTHLRKPVLLVGAFTWRVFQDNLEIHI